MRLTSWIVAAIVIAACARQPKSAAPEAVPTPSPAPTKPAGEMSPPLVRRTCGLESGRLSGDRAGAIRLGMHVDSVKRLCQVIRDTTHMPEGMPQRVIVIAAGGDTLRSWVTDSGRVLNVIVESPHFMTPDSLRVGVPLGRLLGYPGITGAYGEGPFYVFSDAPAICGLSFEIDFGRQRPFIRNPTRETLEPYANSARVRSILVRSCAR
jgi:hypothetical protein